MKFLSVPFSLIFIVCLSQHWKDITMKPLQMMSSFLLYYNNQNSLKKYIYIFLHHDYICNTIAMVILLVKM